MVGASFAIALGKAFSESNKTILVVESTDQHASEAMQSSFDARSTALSYGSSKIFSSMGLWQEMARSVTPILEIQVSDKGRFGSVKITSAEQHVDALGYVIENRDLGDCLNAAINGSSIVQILRSASIQLAAHSEHGMSLQITSGGNSHALETRLLILADGGKSPVCKTLGISHREEQYDQQALIANIAVEMPHRNIAFERFTDSGPLAVLPLAENGNQYRCSLVWTLRNDQVGEYLALSDSEIMSRLQKSFGNRLGKIQQFGKRYCNSLGLMVATEQIRPGLVLLGNVAHTLHPVAGQGLNLALRDAEALVETLLQASVKGEHLGSIQVLQRYLHKQQADQNRTINFTDITTRMFSSNSAGKVLLRKFGLLGIDLIPALRREFSNLAMGISSNY